MRPTVKRLLGFGAIAAAGYAAWRAFETRRRPDSNVTWQPQPFPYPPVPREPEPHEPEPREPETTTADARAAEPAAGAEAGAVGNPDDSVPAWVEPEGATCPATHPVKGKLSSGIFHVPGGASYERTRPDRCYPSATAAEADGLRASKV